MLTRPVQEIKIELQRQTAVTAYLKSKQLPLLPLHDRRQRTISTAHLIPTQSHCSAKPKGSNTLILKWVVTAFWLCMPVTVYLDVIPFMWDCPGNGHLRRCHAIDFWGQIAKTSPCKRRFSLGGKNKLEITICPPRQSGVKGDFVSVWAFHGILLSSRISANSDIPGIWREKAYRILCQQARNSPKIKHWRTSLNHQFYYHYHIMRCRWCNFGNYIR